HRANATLFRVPLLRIDSSELRTALSAWTRLETKTMFSLSAIVFWTMSDDTSGFSKPTVSVVRACFLISLSYTTLSKKKTSFDQATYQRTQQCAGFFKIRVRPFAHF